MTIHAGASANVITVRDRAVVYWEGNSVTTAVVVVVVDASEDRAIELARRLDE